MENITAKKNVPHQRVDESTTLEGVPQGNWIRQAPPVVVMTNPTAPVVIQTTPRTHQRNARHNTPGITLAIDRQIPNAIKSPCLNPMLVQNAPMCTDILNLNLFPSFSHHAIILREAVNLLTQRVRDTPREELTPKDFLDHSPTERAKQDNFHGVYIDHFCAAMVHSDKGETITQ